jgi:hypothetical protein
MTITANNTVTNTLTVTRAANGTIAAAHNDDAVVAVIMQPISVSTKQDAYGAGQDGANEAYTVTLSSPAAAAGTAPTIADASGVGIIADADFPSVTFGQYVGLLFGPGGDQVVVADADALDVTGNFSLETWLYLSAEPGQGGKDATASLIDKGNYGLYLTEGTTAGDGLSSAMFYTNDGDKQIAVKADSIALNTWTHVAGTFEAGANNQKLYINGSNTGVTNATNSALSANATALSIGNIAAAGQDFYGLIDEARVWNTTRTADEILDNKKVALRGDEMGMVGQWKFDMNLYDGTSGGDTAVTYTNALDGTYQYHAGGWSTVSAWYDATTLSTSDPIVLDLDGDGVSLVGRDAGVRFDIDQVEGAEATSWMGPGEGLLAMDLDGDGVISSMGEVFSNRFAGGNHTTSLDALATLDSNSDGMINALDTAFADILVWQDGDQDGSSAAGELQSLDSHGVASIDLGADSTYETGPDGTHIDARGEFTFADGSTSEYVEATFGFTDSVIEAAVQAAISADSEDSFTVNNASTPVSAEVDVIASSDPLGAEAAVADAPETTTDTADTLTLVADAVDTDETAAAVAEVDGADTEEAATDTLTLVADAVDTDETAAAVAEADGADTEEAATDTADTLTLVADAVDTDETAAAVAEVDTEETTTETFVVDADSDALDTDTDAVVADTEPEEAVVTEAIEAESVVAEVSEEAEPDIEVDGYTTSAPSTLLVTAVSTEQTAIAA